MKNYFIIVVTYEPDIEKIIYMSDVIKNCGYNLVVIDNSIKNPISKILALNSGFKLFSLKENFGIAYAQNVGINYALKEKGEYISFFDQDSVFDQEFLSKLYFTIKENKGAVISPLIKDKNTNDEIHNYKLNDFGYPKKIYAKNRVKTKVDIIISSGLTCTLLTLQKIGLMNEDFFIDYIDTEWCIRCKKQKIPIFVFSNIIMYHKIGDSFAQKFGYKTNIHSEYRTYYKIRNIFLFNRCNNVPFLMKVHGLLSVYFHILLQFAESSNKKFFLRVLFEGTKDGLLNVSGKKLKFINL